MRRTAPPGPLRCCITLQLHEAADADKRSVVISYAEELRDCVAPADSLRQQLHEFVTQVHEYEAAAPAGQEQQPAAAAAAVEHAAASPEQQPKRQKTDA